MSKAEKFICEHTKTYSNVIIDYQVVYNGLPQAIHKEWLTPDQARRAVEIAREEVIDKTLDFLKDKLYEIGYIGIMDLCDEYIKAMKNE